jgi:chromosome segregation ATPase
MLLLLCGLQEAMAQGQAAAAANAAADELHGSHSLAARNAQLQQQVDAQAVAMESLAKATDEAALQLALAKEQCEKLQVTASSREAAAAALESRVAELQAEVRF